MEKLFHKDNIVLSDYVQALEDLNENLSPDNKKYLKMLDRRELVKKKSKHNDTN